MKLGVRGQNSSNVLDRFKFFGVILNGLISKSYDFLYFRQIFLELKWYIFSEPEWTLRYFHVGYAK